MPKGWRGRRTGPFRPRRLTPAQMAELAGWVEAGPIRPRSGTARRSALAAARLAGPHQARIRAVFGVVLHERSVGKQLAALGFRRLSVRPQHPKSDPLAQAAFKKTSPKP